MKTVPGIEVFGGIVLNNAVGGINPAAVEWMHRMSGGRGKVVWLPTFDSDKHIKTLVDPKRSGIVVAPNGVVTPQVDEVLRIIARENLVLATGHIHAAEVVAVVKRARELGVKNILITHGLTNIPGLSIEQAKQVVQMGAYIEYCYLQALAGPDAQHAWLRHWNKVSLKAGRNGRHDHRVTQGRGVAGGPRSHDEDQPGTVAWARVISDPHRILNAETQRTRRTQRRTRIVDIRQLVRHRDAV
jgi:hypothetical protein